MCALATLSTSRFSVYARPLVSQALALALYSGRYWPVSIALVAKAIGATIASSFSRGSSFTTALTVRTAVNRHDTEALSHWQRSSTKASTKASSTYSPSERRSYAGASSSSSCEIVIGSSTPSFAAQGNADQDSLDA